MLIVVPVNTIQNWANEFDRWCPVEDTSLDYQRPYQLYLANESLKKGNQQVKLVQDWCTTGGTLIMGYELFLRMVGNKSRPRYSIAQVSTETADGGEALSTTEGNYHDDHRSPLPSHTFQRSKTPCATQIWSSVMKVIELRTIKLAAPPLSNPSEQRT